MSQIGKVSYYELTPWASRILGNSKFIIFQDLKFSVQPEYFTFFRHRSQQYSINSPYIWLTNSEIFL